MSKTIILPILLFGIIFSSCISDDYVEDEVSTEIRILNPIDSLAMDSTHTFEYAYFNNVGQREMVNATWSSSDASVITINSSTGEATAVEDMGNSTITVSFNGVSASHILNASDMTTSQVNTDRSGVVNTTSSYALTGSFTLKQINANTIRLEFDNSYNASTSLPGLYVYLSNNPNTSAGAHEIAKVTTFSGAHFYDITGVGINDYSHVLYFCKPFNVKVGSGAIN